MYKDYENRAAGSRAVTVCSGDDGGGNVVHLSADAPRSAPATEPVKPPPGLTPWWAVEPETKDFWLIRDLLTQGGLSVLYGQPGSGKSTLALDIAFAVATGQTWAGRRVHKSGVIYQTAEGVRGFKNRVVASQRAFREAGRALPGACDLNFDCEALNLLGSDEPANRIIAWAEWYEKVTGDPVALIVIDTLANTMPGGEDATQKDMGRVVFEAQRIARATGAHVMLVHHPLRDGSRDRGHGVLSGAADTKIEVGKNEAKVTKQKDGENGTTFAFKISGVTVGTDDDDGQPVTAPIVMEVTEVKAGSAKASASGELLGRERSAYGFLTAALEREGIDPPDGIDAPEGAKVVPLEVWRRDCLNGGLVKNGSDKTKNDTFRRVREQLAKGKHVGICFADKRKREGFVWIAKAEPSGNSSGDTTTS